MVNIIQDFIPVGRRNRPGRSNPMEFITIHNTGNTNRGANARAHNSYIRGSVATNLPVSWHYTVDDGEIYQHLPDNEDAFHAADGSGPGNRRSIGIEICINSDGNLLRATDNAVWLVATLMVRYNVSPENIRRHRDWRPTSSCPAQLRSGQPYNWAEFVRRATAAYEEMTQPPAPTTTFSVRLGSYNTFDEAQATLERALEAGFDDAVIIDCECTPPTEPNPEPPPPGIVVGSHVRLTPDATVYGRTTRFASFVYSDTWIVLSISGERVVINRNVRGTHAIMSPVSIHHLVLA